MCGIAGFIPTGVKEKDKVLNQMLESIRHRGPDDSGKYQDIGFAFGMRRLSIIDLQTGHQPIFNEDKSMTIVFNGEIYNFPELYTSLVKLGHKFATKSDTEIILHLYEQYGAKCLQKLNGMFAFCIYEKAKQKLFLAIDRIGKKPLYYYHNNSDFAFASEIKAFYRLPYFKKIINWLSLQKYLIYGYIPTPLTPFENVSKLPAGHYMEYSLKNNTVKIHQYWDFNYQTKLNLSEREWLNKIDSILEDSVARRLISDVPLGCFLSGGIDSSLIVAKMKQLSKSNDIQTFSIGFDEAYADESRFAKQVSDQFKTHHHHKIFRFKEALSISDEIFAKLDEPLADPSILPTYLLSEFTRNYVTVALSGDGGDEMFGGYPKYLIHKYSPVTNLFSKGPILETAQLLLARLPLKPENRYLNYKLKRFVETLSYSPLNRNQLWVGSFLPHEAEELIGDHSEDIDILCEANNYLKHFNGDNLLDKMFYLDSKLMLKDAYLAKVDRASMAASLEVRSPFLDRQFLDLTGQIPSSLKLRNHSTKYLLKKVALRYFPEKFVNRPKRGFGLPLAIWLRNPRFSRKFMQTAKEYLPKDTFNHQTISHLLSRHQSGTEDCSTKLWTIYVLSLWFKYNL